MAETLTAQLGLNISAFQQALQQAQHQMQAFAQNITQQLQQVANAFTQSSQATQRQTQTNQQAQQSTNQLAAAYLSMAQAINNQTAAYAQAQAAALQFRQQQAAVAAANRAAAQAAQQAAQHTAALGSILRTALGVAGGLGLDSTFRQLARSVKDFVSEAVSGFAQFQAEIAKTGTQIAGFDLSGKFDAMADAIHRLAVQSGRDTSDLNKSMFELVGTFSNAAQAFTVLEGSTKLAVGGFTDVFNASQAVSGVLKGLNLDVSETNKVANALFVAANQGRQDVGAFARSIAGLLPTLSAFRVDLRDAGAAMALLTAENFTAGEAVTALSRLIFAIGAPTARAQKYMEALAQQLGVAKIEIKKFEDGTADLISTVRQFESISPDALRRLIPNETSLKGLITILNSMDAFRAKIDEARSAGDALTRAQELANQTIQQTWNQASQAVKVFEDAVGAVIGKNAQVLQTIKAVEAAFLAMAQVIKENEKGLKELIDALSSLAKVGISAMTAIGNAAIWAAARVTAFADATLKHVSFLYRAIQGVKGLIDSTVSGGGGDIEGPSPAEAALPASPAVVAPPRAAPRISLGDLNVGGGRRGGGRGSSAAEREAERAAEERKKITQQMLADIAEFEEGAFRGQQERLKKEVEEAREAGVEKEIIARYERDMLMEYGQKAAKEVLEAWQKTYDDWYEAEQEFNLKYIRATKGKTEAALEELRREKDALHEKFGDDIRITEYVATQERKIFEERDKEIQETAEKAQRPYRQLAQSITGFMQNAFASILSGTKSFGESIKSFFINLLAKLAAEAVAHAIVIPIITQFFGGGGGGGGGIGGAIGQLAGIAGSVSGGGGGGFAGTAGSSGGGGNLFGQAANVASIGKTFLPNSVSGSLFGPGSTIGGLLSTPIFTIGGSAAAPAEFGAVFGAGEFAAADATASTGAVAGTTVTAGAALSAIGAGIAVGSLASDILHSLGLHGRANGAVSGALGGAVAGTIILPGIGTVIGAAIGAILGTLLGAGKKPPSFDIKTVEHGRVGFNETTQQLEQLSGFSITDTSLSRVGKFNLSEFITGLNSGLDDIFKGVISSFQSVSPDIQRLIPDHLDALSQKIAADVIKTRFSGDDWSEQLQKYFGTELPNRVKEWIKPLRAAVDKMDPVVKQFDKIIDAITKDIVQLGQNQANAHNALSVAGIGLQTALFTPAQSFLFEQDQLRALQAQFDAGNPQQRIQLAPQIAEAAAQVLNLAKSADVLGQDPQALRNLQADLVKQVKNVQDVTDESFVTLETALKEQLDIAQQQRDLLVNSIKDLDSVDASVKLAVDQLNQLNSTLGGPLNIDQNDATVLAQTALLGGIANVGASQLVVLQEISAKLGGTVPQFAEGSSYIPRNMLAYLHQGERVVAARDNAAGSTDTLRIEIASSGVTSADDRVVTQVADQVIARIEQRGSRIQNTRIQVNRR